jgi:hypothetical protein
MGMNIWDELEEILRRKERAEEEPVPESMDSPAALSPLLEKAGLGREELILAQRLVQEAEATLPHWEHRNLVLVLLALVGKVPPVVHPTSLIQAFSLGMAYQKMLSELSK